MQPQIFKVILIGHSNVGKTSFVHCELGVTSPNMVPTVGVEVHPLTYETNKGHVTLNMWDIGSMDLTGGLVNGYCLGGDIGVIMTSMNPETWNVKLPNNYPSKRFVCINSNEETSGVMASHPHCICHLKSKDSRKDVIQRIIQSLMGEDTHLI